MTGPEIVKEYGAALVPLVVALFIGIAEPLRKLMDRHPVVRNAAATEAVTQDVVTAVRLAVAEAREKDAAAFKDVLDRMEARELHLTDQNETLLRLMAVHDESHRVDVERARNAEGGAQAEAREARFELEKCVLREKDLQKASMAQDRAHMSELNTVRRDKEKLRLEVEHYVRRYGDLGGKFTATDVLGGDL